MKLKKAMVDSLRVFMIVDGLIVMKYIVVQKLHFRLLKKLTRIHPTELITYPDIYSVATMKLKKAMVDILRVWRVLVKLLTII